MTLTISAIEHFRLIIRKTNAMRITRRSSVTMKLDRVNISAIKVN